jgi:hypothetical protein
VRDLGTGVFIAVVITVCAYVIGQVVPLEWMSWRVAALAGVALSFVGWLLAVAGGDG